MKVLERNTKKSVDVYEDEDVVYKSPSFSEYYIALIGLFVMTFIAISSICCLYTLEKNHQNDIAEIKHAFLNLKSLAKIDSDNIGEDKKVSIYIDTPKVFSSQEDILGSIIPIIQEENSRSYDKVNNNLTMFSILITIVTITLPIFNYVFLQRDQMQRIDARHSFLSKKVNSRMKELEKQNKSLEEEINKGLLELRNQINLSQQVTESVIPDSCRDTDVEITTTSKKPEDSARALSYSARINSNKRNLSKALSQINKAIELVPNDADYYDIKSSILFNMNKYEEAIAIEDIAIEIEPNNADYYMNKSAIEKAIRRFREALVSIKLALRIEPGNFNFKISYINTLLAAGKYEEALQFINKELETDLNNTRLLMLLVITLTDLNRTDEASETIEKALSIEKYDPELYHAKAYVYQKMKLFSMAQDFEHQAVFLSKGESKYVGFYAWLFYRMGRYAEALNYLAQNDTCKNSSYYFRTYAMSTFKKVIGESQDISLEYQQVIIENIDKAIEMNYGNVRSRLCKAEVLLYLRKFEEAYKILVEADEILPNYDETLHMFAVYYRTLNDSANAEKYDRLAIEKGYIAEQININTAENSVQPNDFER